MEKKYFYMLKKDKYLLGFIRLRYPNKPYIKQITKNSNHKENFMFMTNNSI